MICLQSNYSTFSQFKLAIDFLAKIHTLLYLASKSEHNILHSVETSFSPFGKGMKMCFMPYAGYFLVVLIHIFLTLQYLALWDVNPKLASDTVLLKGENKEIG